MRGATYQATRHPLTPRLPLCLSISLSLYLSIYLSLLALSVSLSLLSLCLSVFLALSISPHARCCFPCRQSTHPPPTPRLIAPPWPILQTAALFIGTPSSQMTINLYCIFIYYYEFVLHHYKFVLRYYRFVPCYFHFVLRCVVALLICTASRCSLVACRGYPPPCVCGFVCEIE